MINSHLRYILIVLIVAGLGSCFDNDSILRVAISCSSSDSCNNGIIAELSGLQFYENLDTVFQQYNGRAIYKNDNIQLTILHVKGLRWSFRDFKETMYRADFKSNEIEILDSSSQLYGDVKVDLVEYYYPVEKRYKKSWIWNLGNCEYLISMQIFNQDRKQAISRGKNVSLMHLEIPDIDHKCGYDPMDDKEFIKHRDLIEFY